MKRVFVITVLLVFLMSSVVNAQTITIKDIDPSDTTFEKVIWACDQGYMKPTLGKFYPQNKIRRGEFALMLSRVTGDIVSLKKPVKATFSDVPTSDQYFRHIETMKTYINSYKLSSGAKLFKPKEYITREDAAMAIVKVMGYDTDKALLDGVESDISIEDIISDYKQISPANMKYVEIAVINELLDFRTDAQDHLFFDPKRQITRFEMADLLWTAKQKRDYLKEKYEEDEVQGTEDTASDDQNVEDQNSGNNNKPEQPNGNDYPYDSSTSKTDYPWSRDITVPFIDDPQVIGTWVSVDFVNSIDSFAPGYGSDRSFFLDELTFKPKGLTNKPWFKWTKGHILNVGGDRTNGNLVIKEISGEKYLFLQWICGDQLIRGTEPSWYVMKLKE